MTITYRFFQVGRKKVEEAGLSSSVQLHIGDAQDLADVPDGSIDKVGGGRSSERCLS